MLSIDYKKTAVCLIILFAILGAGVYFFGPGKSNPVTDAISAKTQTIPSERITPRFDSRTWKIGHEIKQDGKIVIDYIPEQETIENWTEMVTVQAFGGLQEKGTPAEFAAGMEKYIKDKAGDNVVFSTLRSTNSDHVFEWTISGRKDYPDQYALCRIIRGNEGIHVIFYAAKASARPETKKAEWLKRLETVQLATVKQ